MAGKGTLFLRFLRAVFLEDWLLKIFCMILATLYWFYIDGELTDERELSVNIPATELQPPPGARFAADQRWPALHIRVRGPRRKLQYLGAENLRVHLKPLLSKLQAGDQRLSLGSEVIEIEGVEGLSVVNVRPEDVDVRLFQVSRKLVQVQPRLKGEPPPEYTVDKRVEPQQVTVEALQDLSTLPYVLTEPIDIGGKNREFTVEVGIAPTVEVGDQTVHLSCEEKVRVQVIFERTNYTKDFKDVPVYFLTPQGAAMSAAPRSVSVRVRGTAEDIANVTKADLRVYVEWPAEWDLQRPAHEVFEERTLQVKVVAPPRIGVLGPEGERLPSVKVRGVLTGNLNGD
ncbi:MAG: hypothetical protein M5U26_18330 [Planctomycetota bacterium]|nr:hypothetical protein [Planctomycetota bacterium]